MSGVMQDLTLSEVARQLDVSPATLRRWVRDGIVPLGDGALDARGGRPRAHHRPPARARVLARRAARGRALGPARLQLPWRTSSRRPPATRSLQEAADECGLEPALIERIWTAAGFSSDSLEQIGEEDLQLLRYMAAALDAGFPLVAFLQLVRVYGQAVAKIADAEVKLFHLYVHEPLMRDGVGGLAIAEAMEGMASELLPLASPIMDRIHQRMLQHFVGQDIVGHLELDGAGEDLGRLRVAIAFADLAGYTRLTEEAGEEEALDMVERFVESVEDTLPDDARVVKTIGDEVMIVGADPAALVDWAVGFQQLNAGRRPLPRIGVHAGETLYRDGDYYGRAVNLASRVGARAAGGEVLVTQPVVDAARAATSTSSRSARSSSRASAWPPSSTSRGWRHDGRRPPVRRPRLRLPARSHGAPGRARSRRCTSTTGCVASADEDETFCRSLCERLGVPLVVHRAGPPEGNVQAWAREVRYAEAAKLGPVVATGHTATDQVETVLYRLAALAGPARPAGHPRAPGRHPPAAGLDAGGDGGVLRRARAGRGARTRPTTTTRSRATGCATSCCPRCARCTRPPRPTSCARWRSCATRPRCSTRSSTSTRRWSGSPRCRRRCGG